MTKNRITETENRTRAAYRAVSGDVKGDVKSGRGGKVIALLGVHNMVIVETPDAILVCSKEEAQNIKKIL